MKLVEISALAIRLIGIFLLFRTFEYFVAWFIALRNVGVSEVIVNEQLANITVYGIPAFISLVLILFPVSLAKILVPRSSDAAIENDLTTSGILYALVVAVGLFVIARALPDIAYNVLMLISINSFQPINGGSSMNEYIINAIVSFIELFIGGVMTIRTKYVLSAINKARQ